MKRIILSLLIVMFLVNQGRGQKLPTLKEKYDFLRWYLKSTSPKMVSDSLQPLQNFGFKLADFKVASSYKIAFNYAELDTVFIDAQMNANQNEKILDKKFFKNVNWKSSSSAHLPITYISLPVFSKDRKLAIINYSYYCGSLCGNGGGQLFRKIKGKWTQIKIPFFGWIS